MPPTDRPTPRQIAHGLGALVVLVAGLAGIPAVLALSVGWPLPHHVPTSAQLGQALRSPIPDAFWPRLFATLGWVAWAYLVLTIVDDLIARLRGVRRLRFRLLGAPGAGAALIAAVLVLGQLRPPPSPRPAPPVPGVTLVLNAAPATTASPTATDAAAIHTVVRGDSLWSIAATYYGDGERWPTIFQANVGVPQPGGGALTDAHWIYPGWKLVVPDASPATPPMATTPASVPSPAVTTLPTAPTTSVPHHRAVSPTPASRSRITSTVKNHSTPRNHHPHTEATRRPGIGNGHHDDSETMLIGAGILGLGAIGLVGALDSRRRRQSGRRSPGRRIPLPAPGSPVAGLERQLRHYARADAQAWLSRLGDVLAHAAQEAGTPWPQVLGVWVRPDGLEVVVDSQAGEAPVPFEGRHVEPTVWHLPFTADLGVLDDAVVGAPIALVLFAVGSGADGTLLVNLDHYRSVHLSVDAERVSGTLAAIATDLSTAARPRPATVIAVGFGHGVIDRLDNGVVVDDLDNALARLSPYEEAVILADASTLSSRLAGLVVERSSLCVVTAGPEAPAGVSLSIDPTTLTLAWRHLDPVEPTYVADETLAHVDALLGLAEGPATASPADQPYSALDLASTRAAAPRTGAVTLGVLGEPTIAVGTSEAQDLFVAASPVAGTKARRVVELLVYLAVHDGTATRGQWLTDASPDKALSDGYVRNLVLLTRRFLEELTGIPDLLTYDRATQRLSLAPGIGSDWVEFRSLAASREPQALRTALSLVRGTPLGTNPEPWASASGISYVMVDDVTDAAITLGEHALTVGDRQLATWAARQGQVVNRYDQRLWRLLLQAAANPPGVHGIWRELHALLAVDGDPDADLDPITVDLYNALRSPTPTADQVVILQRDDDVVIPTRHVV